VGAPTNHSGQLAFVESRIPPELDVLGNSASAKLQIVVRQGCAIQFGLGHGRPHPKGHLRKREGVGLSLFALLVADCPKRQQRAFSVYDRCKAIYEAVKKGATD
jgi:hypothetical protein